MNKSKKRLSVSSVFAVAFWAIVSYTAVELIYKGAAPHKNAATSSGGIICGRKYATKYQQSIVMQKMKKRRFFIINKLKFFEQDAFKKSDVNQM